MRFVIATISLFLGLQLHGTLVAGQQRCPDAAISRCISYITQPVMGSTVLEQQINDSCARVGNLSICLPMSNGCPMDLPITGQVRDAMRTFLNQICASNRERLVIAANCWNKPGTLSKISSCNSTFSSSLLSGSPYCDAAGTYLTCVETATLADCGAETMLFYTKYTYAALVGFAVAKNCQILSNRCQPWNITTCLNNINTPLGASGLGKEALKSNIDRICGKTDDITTCLTSNSCPSGNTFYQLVNNQIQTSYNAICQEKDKTSYYGTYADCWTREAVKSGVSVCNNTFMASLKTSASYCTLAGAFLKCSKDQVTAQCGSDSGAALAGYLYNLLSINATAYNCAIDAMFASPAPQLNYSSTSTPSSVSLSSSVDASISASSSASLSGSSSVVPSLSMTGSPTTNNLDSTYTSASPFISSSTSSSYSTAMSNSLTTTTHESRNMSGSSSVSIPFSQSTNISGSTAMSNSSSTTTPASASLSGSSSVSMPASPSTNISGSVTVSNSSTSTVAESTSMPVSPSSNNSSSVPSSASLSGSPSALVSLSTTVAYHTGSAPHIQTTVGLILSSAVIAILPQLY